MTCRIESRITRSDWPRQRVLAWLSVVLALAVTGTGFWLIVDSHGQLWRNVVGTGLGFVAMGYLWAIEVGLMIGTIQDMDARQRRGHREP